jgi:hypothetical protein
MISHSHIVVLRVRTPCSLVGGIDISEEHTILIFSTEVNKVWRVAGYTEVEGKEMSHG